MPKFSRRDLAKILLAPLFRSLQLNGQPAASSRTASRTYRCDAVIPFFGITIFRRTGVGGGQASLEETGEGADLRRTLFFAAGSDPKRAHGLSRLGWMREVVLGPSSSPSEAAYFGVLSASPEESLEHARKSVDASPGARGVFAAVNGRNTAGHSRSAVTHFEYAASALWNDRGLIEQAQSAFSPGANWRETAWPKVPNQTPPTFLLAMAVLLKQRSRRGVSRYVYNEQEYQLELDWLPVGHNRERLLPVKGKIRNLRTGFETPFRLWLDEASDSIVPVRFEVQPRSFLRLAFEGVAG
jgi:hypothetical protein